MVFSNLIALYLFLGGASAGAYAVVATADMVLYLRMRSNRIDRRLDVFSRLAPTLKRLRCIVYGAAAIMLAAGMLCLVFDLGRPGLFYYLMMHPTMSFMSIGAFSLGTFAVCIAFALIEALCAIPQKARAVTAVVKAVGIPVAVVVMVYTGLLLESVMAVAFWQSVWLPVLFAASALSCGCAIATIAACVVEDVRVTGWWKDRLARIDAAVIVVEAFAWVLFAASVAPITSPDVLGSLFTGEKALAFWIGFIGCGLAAPLTADIYLRARNRTLSPAGAVSIASLVLVGGLVLRLLVVASGVQTAV